MAIPSLILRVLNGPQRGQEYTLVREQYSVGKHEGNDIVLTHQTVSRNHCEFTREADEYRLRDLGSTNGTLVDGVSVRQCALRSGSVITLGQVDLRVTSMLPEQILKAPRSFDPGLSYRENKANWESAYEAAYVKWLLGEHGGNISAASRAAQMDRKYLYKLAVRYGVHVPRKRS